MHNLLRHTAESLLIAGSDEDDEDEGTAVWSQRPVCDSRGH